MTNQKEKRNVPELRFPEFSGEWEKIILGDNAVIKGRLGWKGLKQEEYVENGYSYLIAGKHIKNGSIDWNKTDQINKQRYDESIEIALQKGDVIFSKDGSLGNPAQIKELPKPATINSTMMLIRTEKNTIVPDFMYQVLNSNIFKKLIHLKVSGSSIPHLFQADMKEFTFFIPSLKEQQKIGEFFSKLDRQIELEEKKLALLEEQKKGYMQKIFSQELRFKDENGVEYPEWKEVFFSKLFKSNIEKNNDLEFDKNNIISVAKMQYKEDNNKDSSNEYMKTYNKIRVNDIAFEGNKSKDYRYGRFVLNDIGDGIVSHVFVVFSPIMDFESSFMKYYINYEPIMGRKLLFATTSTLMMTSLKTKEFMNLSIRLPEIDEQRKIGTFLKIILNNIDNQKNKISLLKKIKMELLNKMFM